MESLIRDKIIEHFGSNNLFSSQQFGFIKGRSAVLQLLKIVDDWTLAIDAGREVEIVYTDFAKAFDIVPHQRLLAKLKIYGLNDALIGWIREFLCYRTQVVRIGQACSNPVPVVSGIPQGSVLRHLLFITYVNDVPEVWNHLCSVFLFADDAKLYKIVERHQDLDELNSACEAFLKWCDK